MHQIRPIRLPRPEAVIWFARITTLRIEYDDEQLFEQLWSFPVSRKLTPFFLLSALHGCKLPICGDNQNVRDWLHVDDHCLGIELCILSGRAGEAYNIGGGQELPNIQVVDEICRAVETAFTSNCGLAVLYPEAPAAQGRQTAELEAYVEDRKGHDRRYAIDETKCRSELGYAPVVDFATGFAQTLAWYLGNEGWWHPILNRCGPARAGSASRARAMSDQTESSDGSAIAGRQSS